jgi:thiamine biosynthesis lipoprotein
MFRSVSVGSQRAAATTIRRREFLRAGAPSAQRQSVFPEQRQHWIRIHRLAMACRFEITLAIEDAAFVPAARTALDQIDALEQELSVFREESVISTVNRSAASNAVQVPGHVIGLLSRCQQLYEETRGAFDATTTPLSRCWGFLRREGRVPEDSSIEEARAKVGFDAVQLDRKERTIRFSRPGIELNLGAVGKGYALDRVAVELRTGGVRHVLLSAGRSSLLALGGRDGGWPVDVVSPLVSERPLARLWIRDGAVGTSGCGEQFVIADGRRYGHVIDPRTGWPARGVLTASVAASKAELADALSTAFFVGGVELARTYCAAHPGVLAILTPDEGPARPIVVGSRFGTHVQTL